MHRPRLIILVAAALSLPAAVSGFDGRLRLEGGEEYDSNAGRTYGERAGDWLSRLLVEGQGSEAFGAHRLSGSAGLGGKLFYRQDGEDLLALRAGGAWSWTGPSGASVGAEAGYLENFMRVHRRDWRELEGRLLVELPLSTWLFLEGWLGGRWFVFKPDRYLEYQIKLGHLGPAAGLRLAARPEAEARLDFFYQVEASFYGTPAAWLQGDSVFTAVYERRDIIHLGGLDLCRRFKLFSRWHALLDLAWHIQVVDSNSFGSAAVRHRLRLAAVLELPRVALQLLGTLQFTTFPDGAYLEGNLYEPDADENENTLVARLRVGLWRGLGAYLQGTLFRNAFAASRLEVPRFSRETVGLGLYYELAADGE